MALGLGLSPIVLLFQLAADYLPIFRDGVFGELIDSQSPQYSPLLAFVVVCETVVNLALGAAAIWLFVLMLRHSSRFPPAMIAFLVARLLIVLGDEALTSQVLQLDPATNPTDYAEIARALIYAVVWSLYLLKSERVERTFVE